MVIVNFIYNQVSVTRIHDDWLMMFENRWAEFFMWWRWILLPIQSFMCHNLKSHIVPSSIHSSIISSILKTFFHVYNSEQYTKLDKFRRYRENLYFVGESLCSFNQKANLHVSWVDRPSQVGTPEFIFFVLLIGKFGHIHFILTRKRTWYCHNCVSRCAIWKKVNNHRPVK